jgi:hypothetical protein
MISRREECLPTTGDAPLRIYSQCFYQYEGLRITIKKLGVHRLPEYTHSSNRGKGRKSNINTRIRNNCKNGDEVRIIDRMKWRN